MKRVLRKSRFGYGLSLMLILVGFSVLFLVFWETWIRTGSIEGFLSAFWNILLTEEYSVLGARVKLAFFAIFGITAIGLGIILWVFSRRWFVIGEKMLVECPFCRNRWRTGPQKALVHCPYCKQLVHPKIVEG